MNKKRISVKDITIASLLTALAFIISLYMPKLPLGPVFSATFASHVPGILAIFISPFAVIGTSVGSALGFLMNLGNPWIAARAAVHLFFGLTGYFMVNKKYNIILTIFVTGIVHAAAEVVVGIVSIKFVGMPAAGFINGILLMIGCGTLIHHCIDFAISLVVYTALKPAKLLGGEVNYKSFKA